MLEKIARTQSTGLTSRLQKLASVCAGIATPKGQAAQTVRYSGIDLMACVLIGAMHPAAEQARTALRSYTGSAPIFGTGNCLAAPFAALCNAVAGQAFELDDWEEPGNTHPSVVLFPALWALAAERGASGADITRAYAAGFEAITCLGSGLNFEHYKKGWHSTATLGVIGAAAACANLLRLSAGQTAHAMSLAISQSSGLTCQFGSGAKPLQAGFPARDGMMAALFAEQGLTGQPGALDAEAGFANLMADGDLAKLDRAIDAASGRALEDWGIILKPYPSCGYTHRLVDCARELSGKFALDEIVSIEAELPDFHAAILPFRHPADRAEALFSIPFCVSTALLNGNLTLADLETRAWEAPATRALIDKVEIKPHRPIHPERNYDPEQPDRLTVTLSCGEAYTATCAYPRGAPQNPLSEDALRAKLEAAAPDLQNETIEALMNWDMANDINETLVRFGAPP